MRKKINHPFSDVLYPVSGSTIFSNNSTMTDNMEYSFSFATCHRKSSYFQKIYSCIGENPSLFKAAASTHNPSVNKLFFELSMPKALNKESINEALLLH